MKNKIEYIFCINTGRSGSGYLSKIFNSACGCVAFHEPQPAAYGYPMYKFLSGNQKLMKKITEEKLKNFNILKKDGDVYIETSHLFIKGFGWLLPEYIDPQKIGVIYLTRNKNEIVDSLLRLETSPLEKLGLDWTITPLKKNPLISPPKLMGSIKLKYYLFYFINLFYRGRRFYKILNLKQPKKPDFILKYNKECLYWYIDEIASMYREYKNKFKNIIFYEVDLNDLNSYSEVKKMLDFFGLAEKDSLRKVIGKKVNTKYS